jgi:uncharacterized membrane protein
MTAYLEGMTSDARRLKRLMALLGVSGVLHLVKPTPYEKIVPPKFGDAHTLVLASGVAEMALAGMLAVPRSRKLAGWLSAGLFVAVFPANVYAVKVFGAHKFGRAAAIARLPLQLPMIAAALKVARES